MEENMLIKYIRDRKWNKVGVVVALDQEHIGYSLCNVSHGDRFDKEKGLMIAVGRAEKHPISIINVLGVASSARTECLKMLDRAKRFYKGASI
jgi:hypothetical protein